MIVCPYCEWPFASKTELATHIQIKHKGALSNLLQQIQAEAKSVKDDELSDDGVYIGDVVIHAPYDDPTETRAKLLVDVQMSGDSLFADYKAGMIGTVEKTEVVGYDYEFYPFRQAGVCVRKDEVEILS